MSKLQAIENSLVDIANTTLANQLESRLKELERNIAVARQFIGVAEECYGKVKREWELLQQDIGVKNTTTSQINQTRFPSSLEERADEQETRGALRREKKNKSDSQRKKVEHPLEILPQPEEHVESANEGKLSFQARQKNPKHHQRRLSRRSRVPKQFPGSRLLSLAR